MSYVSQRKTILSAVTATLLGKFGPDGTYAQWFRSVRRGMATPTSVYPVLVVSDAGQSRETGEDADDSTSYEKRLRIDVTLQLAEDWTRVANSDQWTERVEAVIATLDRNLPSGCLRFDYLDDDPADIVFLAGSSAAVWQISFEAHYFEDAAAPADPEDD
jgi:hypothetical protein